jgi:hypothetical protein
LSAQLLWQLSGWPRQPPRSDRLLDLVADQEPPAHAHAPQHLHLHVRLCRVRVRRCDERVNAARVAISSATPRRSHVVDREGTSAHIRTCSALHALSLEDLWRCMFAVALARVLSGKLSAASYLDSYPVLKFGHVDSSAIMSYLGELS